MAKSCGGARQVSIDKSQAKRKFHRVLKSLQLRSGLDAKAFAALYSLPHRSVLNWLSGGVCPGHRRLKELCFIFGWDRDALFRPPSFEESCEFRPLSLRTLNQHFLSVLSRTPLEAYNYVSLAGMLVFNSLSESGFECDALLRPDFRTCIQFRNPKVGICLRIEVEQGQGLVIRWLDELQLVRATFPYSEAGIKTIIKHLRSIPAAEPLPPAAASNFRAIDTRIQETQ